MMLAITRFGFAIFWVLAAQILLVPGDIVAQLVYGQRLELSPYADLVLLIFLFWLTYRLQSRHGTADYMIWESNPSYSTLVSVVFYWILVVGFLTIIAMDVLVHIPPFRHTVAAICVALATEDSGVTSSPVGVCQPASSAWRILLSALVLINPWTGLSFWRSAPNQSRIRSAHTSGQ